MRGRALIWICNWFGEKEFKKWTESVLLFIFSQITEELPCRQPEIFFLKIVFFFFYKLFVYFILWINNCIILNNNSNKNIYFLLYFSLSFLLYSFFSTKQLQFSVISYLFLFLSFLFRSLNFFLSNQHSTKEMNGRWRMIWL